MELSRLKNMSKIIWIKYFDFDELQNEIKIFPNMNVEILEEESEKFNSKSF